MLGLIKISDEPLKDSLTDKLGQASHGAEHERGVDHLIQGLVELLPKRGGMRPLHERVKWLRLAAGIFDLGYKADDAEHGEISIAVVREACALRRRHSSTEQLHG